MVTLRFTLRRVIAGREGGLGPRSSRQVACATTQTKETMEMPKISRDSAPQRQKAGPVVDLRGELDGYTVSFTSLLEDIDATPLVKGLPDDRCQCPLGLRPQGQDDRSVRRP